MMRAGKDYIAKGGESEDQRSEYLRELLRAVNAQPAPAETEEAVEHEDHPVKLTNQSKPILKLK